MSAAAFTINTKVRVKTHVEANNTKTPREQNKHPSPAQLRNRSRNRHVTPLKHLDVPRSGETVARTAARRRSRSPSGPRSAAPGKKEEGGSRTSRPAAARRRDSCFPPLGLGGVSQSKKKRRIIRTQFLAGKGFALVLMTFGACLRHKTGWDGGQGIGGWWCKRERTTEVLVAAAEG